MPTKEEMSDFAQHLTTIPHPQLTKRHSISVPSSPFQHSRRLSFRARSPSPDKYVRNGSPKSTHSQMDNSSRARAKAPSFTGCRYETGMAFSRRRMPYSIGGDQLERSRTMPKKFLNPKEEGKLSGDMRELYDRILPSKESDLRRADFVQKLERILNERWPGHEIKVHMFGSSGNMLCTNDSDGSGALDVINFANCTTGGMERVVCVPHAKVPIVKFWDPELQLACDMNVNNTLALENTRMIKTYVEIDERVRPLAMIIKHWTKRRILNDAALGGTLSSYAWICMILNFLQTRNPPILPSLHNACDAQKPSAEGKFAWFNDDLENLRGYGKDNKESLGELLFQFFRRYGHDIDYEKNVVSVREGRLISKEGKKWHLMQNNRLCVEEPFNTDRNLGNTADDISFRGIHLELRRAFDLISEAKLDECLEQYKFPATEEKVWERPATKPAPVLTRSRSQSQSSRGNKSGYGNRGGRHHSNNHSKNRRASSAAATNKYPLPPNSIHSLGDSPMLTQDQAIQAQFDQLKLHRQLFDEMQVLQRQEYELRLKQAQNQLQAEIQLQGSGEGPPNAPHSAREQSHRFQMAASIPLSAPLRAGQHFPPFMYPQVPGTPLQNVHTHPSSPSLRSARPDLRRSIHRSSAADGSSSGSIRSHSQPARAMPISASIRNAPPLPMNSPQLLHYHNLHHQPQLQPDQLYYTVEGHSGYAPVEARGYSDPRRHSVQPPFEDSIPKEYAGYWINDSPSSQVYREDVRMPRMQHFQDLRARTIGIPPSFGRLRDESRSPSPSPALPGRDRAFSLQSGSNGPMRRHHFERVQGTAPPARPSDPIIIDGTDSYPMPECPPMLETSSHTTNVSETTSGSDEQPYETPTTGEIEPYCNGVAEEVLPIEPSRQYYYGHPISERRCTARFDSHGHAEPVASRLVNQPADSVASYGPNNQTEKLRRSGGGLGIQFGEVDYTYPSARAEPSAPREQSRTTHHVSRIDAPAITSTTTQADKAPVPIPLLSPVREVRTPSPVGKRKEDFASVAKTGGLKRPTTNKMDLYIPAFSELLKAKQEKERLQQAQGKQDNNAKMNGTLSPKANGAGISRASATSTPNHLPQPPPNTPSSASPKASGSQPQVNGWQLSSKKSKKNRSRPGSGHYPSEPLPVNEADRKGG
ncbi:MAG: hypothetical protein Q9217_001471 [Psora testacea]